MALKKLVAAAKSGDRLRTLEELRDILAKTIAYCESARDMAALSKRLMEVLDEIAQIKGSGRCQPETAAHERDEVPRFEVIAGRRAERRKAAQG